MIIYIYLYKRHTTWIDAFRATVLVGDLRFFAFSSKACRRFCALAACVILFRLMVFSFF